MHDRATQSRNAAELAPRALLDTHRGQPWPFLLDRAGAASFAGSSPVAQIVVERSGRVRQWRGGVWRTLDAHPIDALAAFVESDRAGARRVPEWLTAGTALPALPRTVGYLAYELGAFVEDVPVAGADPAGLPLAVLSTYDRVEVWAPGGRTGTIEFEGATRGRTLSPEPARSPPMAPALPAATALARYRSGFARIAAAIRAGEIYQANLARRIEQPFEDDAVEAYERLRRIQPVGQGAYLDLGSRQILCNSPECFLRVCGRTIETFPIKGTRPRHADPRRDRDSSAELAADAKERAEHVMIVDLERNDLGRVCRVASVEVLQLARVESYATVHHLVSTVRGDLRDGAGVADVLRAAFPGGSITGAPKIRAMQVIAEIEPQARGVYTGAIGSFNGADAVELGIAIRTAVAGDGRIQYYAGGGIVADSSLEAEYEETNVKAVAFHRSLAAAGAGARAAV